MIPTLAPLTLTVTSIIVRVSLCLGILGLVGIPIEAAEKVVDGSPSRIEKTLESMDDSGRMIALGELLYFDKNLSKNRTQSCATCHDPKFGFVDPRKNRSGRSASLGDDGKSLGDRHAPTTSYASLSPDFHYNKKSKQWVGGQFWDGRSKTLAEQAGGPPFNPIEMGLKDEKAFAERISENRIYRKLFPRLFGQAVLSHPKKILASATKAIEAFEKTEFFAPFDSKYDRFLEGKAKLTDLEELGRSIFFSKSNSSCANCHLLKSEGEKREPFTNFEYHNIGVPTNKPLRSKNGIAVTTVDDGLFANPAVKDEKERGKFKVSTLRNVAITGPYMHNGVFKDLRTVIEFYDKLNNASRKLNPESGLPWAPEEFPDTFNMEDLRTKKLTDRKIDALIAFLKTLTDQRFESLQN